MRKYKLNIVIILIVVLGFLLSQYKAFINPFMINEDIRDEFYMHRFHDNSLFRNDFIADYVSFFNKYCLGYYLFYFIFTYFLDVRIAHAITSFLLFLIATFFAFKLGSRIKNKIMGFFMVLFYIFNFWITADFAGGTRCVFGITIMIIFIYYLIIKSTTGIAISLISMFLFYPILLPPLYLSIFFIYFFKKIYKEVYFNNKTLILFLLIMTISSLVSMYGYYIKTTPMYGELFNYNEMKEMPIFGRDGSIELFPSPSLNQKIWENALKFNFMSVSFIILLFSLRRKLFYLPIVIYIVIASCLLMYKLAVIFMPITIDPSVYADYTIPIFLIILFSFGCSQFLEQRIIHKIRYPFLLFFVTTSIIYHYNNLDSGLDNYSEKIKLFSFISVLPKDILIAGYPSEMDEIAFFCKRKVFISKEPILPFFKKLYKEIDRRTMVFFNLYYSDSPEFIFNLCKENGINYIIVDANYFKQDFLNDEDFYPEPFNSYIKDIIKNKRFFILNNIPEKLKIFSDGDRFIIRVDDIPVINRFYLNNNK